MREASSPTKDRRSAGCINAEFSVAGWACATASVEDWAAFLEGLRDKPSLSPARGGAAVIRRLTGVEVTEAEGGGALVRLFEWVGGARRVMVEARVGS